ncbi:MAG: PAS domain S-box protein [Verrucomicrobiaceae bacterium]|nr:PAS domain S-box protein [Verrucomicrobiaceae bacterium]
MNWRAILLLMAMSACYVGAAEDGSFIVKSWTSADGLPQNTVTAIAQTQDGYLWLGTHAGLARFDGVRFVHFGLAEGLKGLHIRSLVDDGEGGLWIATMGGGLSHLHDGVITTQTTVDGLVTNDLLCLARDGADGLWIGTAQGLQHLENNEFKQVGESEGVRGRVGAMAMTPSDGLWVRVENLGLVRVYQGRCEVVNPPPSSRGLSASSLLADRDGSLWVGMTPHVMLHRKDGHWTEFNEANGVPHLAPYCTAAGNSGEVWLGGFDDGLHVMKEGAVRPVPGTVQEICSLFVMPDGTVWVGTDGSGLFRLTRRKVRSYVVVDEKVGGAVGSLVEESDGTFWVSTYFKGLYHGSLEHLNRVMNEDQPVGGNYMLTTVRMRDGTIFFAGEHILVRKAPNSEVFETMVTSDIPRTLCEGADGSLFMGTEAGELKRLEDGAFYTVEKGTFPHIIQGLIRGPKESLWLATRAGLFQWSAGELKRWTTEEGLPTNILTCLHLDTDDTLWIGTGGGGLAWLENGRLHSVNTRQGLSGNIIGQILDDEQGHLWLGGFHGIMRVNKEELKAVAMGKARTVHPLLLNESHGMLTAECSVGYSPAGLRSASGVLHFVAGRSIVAIDPRDWNHETDPPSVLIEGVRVGGEAVSIRSGSLTLPPGTRDLEIEYTACHFAAPESIHFRHRLAEDRPWEEDMGVRSIRYSDLPAGDYVFEVTAANPDLRWQPAAARLAITIQPYFWQTLPFRLLTVVLLVASGSGWARWRWRAKRRKEIEELERLREKQRADEKFRLALESSPNAIVLAKEDGRIVLVNEQTEKWFGHTREELAGREMCKLIPDWPHAASETKAMNNGRERFGRRKDGTLFPVEIRLSRFETETGPLTLAAIVDITPRRQAEQELARLSRISILGEFAGAIAHELNQPLAAMLSNSQVGSSMMDEPKPDKVEMKAILDDITADAKRAGGIIHGMRAMFKKEGAVPDEAVDVNEAVKQLLDLLHSEIMARKVKVDLRLSGPLPCVPAGRVELQQVLMNLLLNALDALRGAAVAQPRITLSTALEADRVLISVQDNGPGIPPQILERLFEAFTTSKPTGLGLGLAISQGIIKRFGGELCGENHAEGGAVFRIKLPVVE